jgi:hypothetical protein
VNCIQVEKAVFPHPEVREAFKDFVKVALYIPEGDPGIDALNRPLYARIAGDAALPAYAVVDPASEEVLDLFFYDRAFVQDPRVFAERLRAASRRWAESRR